MPDELVICDERLDYKLDPRPLHAVERWVSRLVIDPAGHVIRLNQAEKEE